MDERSSPVTGATDQDDAFPAKLLLGKGYIVRGNKRWTPSSFDSGSAANADCSQAAA